MVNMVHVYEVNAIAHTHGYMVEITVKNVRLFDNYKQATEVGGKRKSQDPVTTKFNSCFVLYVRHSV